MEQEFNPMAEGDGYANEMAQFFQQKGITTPNGQGPDPNRAAPPQEAQPAPENNEPEQSLGGVFNGSTPEERGEATNPVQTEESNVDTGFHTDGYEPTEESYQYYEPVNTTDIIPEDNLYREDGMVFYIDEETKYRDWDALVKGSQDRLAYMHKLEAERDNAFAAMKEREETLMSLQNEVQFLKGIVSKGRNQEDVERELAKAYLPEDLRSVDPASFNVSFADLVPTFDEFLAKKRGAPERGDYSSDREFNRAQWEFEDKMRGEYEKKRRDAERNAREKLRENEDSRYQYETALAEARSKIRREREEAMNQSRLAQESYERRVREAQGRLERVVNDPKRLGVNNKEDEYRAAQLLTQKLPNFNGDDENSLADAMIAIEANFGSEITDLVLDGVKARLSGAFERNVSRKRPAPPRRRPRPSQLAAGSRSRRPAAPIATGEENPEDLFRDAFPTAFNS